MNRWHEVDIFHVEPRHDAVHAALVNWANWARVKPIYMRSPMFRMARSNSRQWHPPYVHDAVDSIAAMKVEIVVASMPELFAGVLRWWYVYQWPSVREFGKKNGMNPDSLLRACHDARTMVANRLGIHVQSLAR